MTDKANGGDLFTVVPAAEAETVKRRPRGANGKWQPVFAALGDGSVLRARVPMNQVGALSRDLERIYPKKRLVSRKTDDPAFRYLWLVDR